MTLKPQQAQALYRLLSSQGMDCSKLKADNPFHPDFNKTPTGRRIQVIIEGLSPQLAVDLKRDANHIDTQPSLAMAAAMADDADPRTFTGQLKSEYINANPQALQDQRQQDETALLAKLDAMTEASQRKREGNRAYDQRLAREKAQAEAAARRRADAIALEKRLAVKRQQDQTNARIAQGNAVIPN